MNQVLIILITVHLALTTALGQNLIEFKYSECIHDISKDSLTNVSFEKKDDGQSIVFGGLAPCNGNLIGEVSVAHDTLNLFYMPKPSIYFDQQGKQIEVIEVADCDCYFRFYYKIDPFFEINETLVFANGVSVHELTKKTTAIQEYIEIDMDNEINETEVIEEVLIDDDPPSDFPDEQPMPLSGMESYYHKIRSNMAYPPKAKQAGVEGRVFVEFIVNEDGSLSQVKVLKGIREDLDEEAIRLISNTELFIPGRHNGKPIKSKMLLPITFKLDAKP